MAGKSDDCSTAYACNTCHDWLDGRYTPPKGDHPWADKEFYWFRGIRRTTRIWLEELYLKTQ